MDIIQEQITLAEKEVKYWYSAGTIPLSSYGAFKYGANTALEQSERKIKALNRLKKRFDQMEQSKKRMDEAISRFQGLEYKIAYRRYVLGKQLNEIADELGYTYEHIRRIHAKLRKDAT
jgi:DNA-directed RNA polymerase specialized sigma subunit